VRRWAEATVPAVDIDAELPKFCDHHTAKDSRFADWDAALRSWLRRSAEYQANSARASPARNGHGASRREPDSRTLDQIADEFEQRILARQGPQK
jgi:hypothetical protein